MDRELKARVIGAGLLMGMAIIWVPGCFETKFYPPELDANLVMTPVAQIEFSLQPRDNPGWDKGGSGWSMG